MCIRDSYCIFARISVVLNIAHVVEIQNSSTKEPNTQGRKEQFRINPMSIQKIGTNHWKDSEEKENCNIAKTSISVWITARSIAVSCYQRTNSQCKNCLLYTSDAA